ncbi:MAG: hypothetical protein J0H14_26080 [Alphaproteobacteria bacterium]|nr:hypothetical protein [Alphaproteobacteria bacterium]
MMRFAIPLAAAGMFLGALILDTEAVLRLTSAMLWDSGYLGLLIALFVAAGIGLAAIWSSRKPARRPGKPRARAGRRSGAARVPTRKSSASRRRTPSRVRPR